MFGKDYILRVIYLDEIVFDYLGNIYASILFKDVVKRYNIRNVSFLENLVSFLAGNLGSIVSAKKIFEIGEKYYFGDIGLRNSISGFNIRDIGKVIENAIFTHLSVQGYAVNVGVSGNREIDFVAQKKGEKLYVQACYLLHDQSTIDREFGNLLAIKDNYPKVVVSMDKAYGKTSYEGIQHLHLKNFLSGSEK